MRTLAILLCLLTTSLAHAVETLRVLSWPGYVAQDAVRAFELRHKVNVEMVEVGSDEELWERARIEGDGRFDVLAVNTAELQRYIQRNLVQPVNTASIPNTRHQLPRFRKLASIPGLVSNDKTWGVPFTFSSMGLIYNRKFVSNAPRSMSALWDKRYNHRIALHNSGSHNFSLTALTLGIRTPFRLDKEQFRSTLNRLLSLRDNDPRFYATPEDLVTLFRDNEIALAFGNYGDQQLNLLRKAGHDVGYALPAEGTLAWLDCWAILSHASDKALAHAWINHMLTSNVATQLTEHQGLANTLRGDQVSSTREQDKLVWLEPVEDAANRARNWERFIAGARYSPRTQSGPAAAPASQPAATTPASTPAPVPATHPASTPASP